MIETYVEEVYGGNGENDSELFTIEGKYKNVMDAW